MPSSASSFAAHFTFTEVFIIFVMATILVLYVKRYYGEVEYTESKVDGRKYLVRKLPDRQTAADTLARINKRLQRLVNHLSETFGDRNEGVNRLRANYDPEALSEGGTEIGYTSYSVNKGEKIVLCLRQKDDSMVDLNTLMYVAIHELGHLMTDEIGHTPKFWDNFRWLLQQAIDIGIYKKINYAKNPQSYCGIEITSSVVS